jgi:hypothetical protein
MTHHYFNPKFPTNGYGLFEQVIDSKHGREMIAVFISKDSADNAAACLNAVSGIKHDGLFFYDVSWYVGIPREVA